MTTPANTGSLFPDNVTVGDLNGDGRLDAVLTDGQGTLRVMIGQGNAAFVERDVTLPPITSASVVNLHPTLTPYLPANVGGFGSIQATDLNHDGRLDLVVVETAGMNFVNYNFIGSLINTGNDPSGLPQFAATHHWVSFLGVRPIVAGDLNGDGAPDVIIGSCCSAVQAWLNDGSGVFSTTQTTGLTPGAGGPAVGPGAIADLNGDGKADYVATSNQNGGANVFFGNGNGTFQTPGTFLPNFAVSVAVADIDNDTRPDLLMADLTSGSEGVLVYRNLGGGAFGSPVVYPVLGAGSVVVADINGDGNLDAVVSNVLNNAGVLLGDGHGALPSPLTFPASSVPTNAKIGDFNNDGKPDISVVLRNSRSMGVLINTTVFAPPVPTRTLTILGGSGNPGDIAANVEYYNPATGNWQPAYLADYAPFGHPVTHPWGNVPGTNRWINYKTLGDSDPGVSDANPRWYLYRVRFTVPADAVNPQMTFSLKADNFAQVAINGANAGGLVQGTADQQNVDAVFAQNVHVGENTITLNIRDHGGLNGFNFRIDLSMQTTGQIEIVPVNPDTTAPAIHAPADLTQEATSSAGAAATFAATATDNIDGAVSVSASPASGSTFPLGSTTVNLSASDAAGNTAHASFTVTVLDTIAPVVTAPANIVAEATGANGAAVSYAAPTATDAVGVTLITSHPPSGSTFGLGSTSVAIAARDAAGNLGTTSFTVTVQDTTPPALDVPANQTIEATSAAGAVAVFAASATDVVGVTSLTSSRASASTFPIGTTTVTVSARDAAGNTTTGSFTITVRDTTAPTLGSVTPSTGSLWPPNHQMVAIGLGLTSSDAVGVVGYRVTATSSEPDNGLGDGDTANDIQITGSGTLTPAISLRAERSGNGNGRTYTITVVAIDAAGNASAPRTTTVSVPKSQSKK